MKLRRVVLIAFFVAIVLVVTGCDIPREATEQEIQTAKAKYLKSLASEATMDSGVGYVTMPPRSIWLRDIEEDAPSGYFYLYYSDIPKIVGHICRQKDVNITQAPQPTTVGLESDNRLTGFYFYYEPD